MERTRYPHRFYQQHSLDAAHSAFLEHKPNADTHAASYYDVGVRLGSLTLELHRLSDLRSPSAIVQRVADILPGVSEYLETSLTSMHRSRDLSLNQLIRADLFNDVAEQILLLPAMFAYPADNLEARRIRESLIGEQGIYGLVAQKIETTYTQFKQSKSQKKGSELAGTLNELCAIALPNRRQNTDSAALPTLPIDDEWRKIDVHYLDYVDGQPARANLQVKSNELPIERGKFGIRIINGADLGNVPINQFWPTPGNMQTVQAIIHEINGVATPEQSAILDTIAAHVTGIATSELRGSLETLEKTIA